MKKVVEFSSKKNLLGHVLSVEYLLWYTEEGGSNLRKFELQVFQGLCVEIRRKGNGTNVVLARKIGGIWVFRRFMVEGKHVVGMRSVSK